MAVEIRYSKRAVRWFRVGADPAARQAMRDKIEQVAADPALRRGWYEKLTNRPGWKIRQGQYRAIVVFEDGGLTVLDVDHRKDVYR
jgi:mRNA interferase RelE/StbE